MEIQWRCSRSKLFSGYGSLKELRNAAPSVWRHSMETPWGVPGPRCCVYGLVQWLTCGNIILYPDVSGYATPGESRKRVNEGLELTQSSWLISTSWLIWALQLRVEAAGCELMLWSEQCWVARGETGPASERDGRNWNGTVPHEPGFESWEWRGRGKTWKCHIAFPDEAMWNTRCFKEDIVFSK